MQCPRNRNTIFNIDGIFKLFFMCCVIFIAWFSGDRNYGPNEYRQIDTEEIQQYYPDVEPEDDEMGDEVLRYNI